MEWDRVSWVLRGGETILPDLNERLPVGAVGGFEGLKVGLPVGFRFRGEDDTGQIQPAQQFQEEQADGASVEILKRVDA